MSSLKITEFLTPMKRKGEALSIKSLKAQIDAMMQATHLIEDEDSRIQFKKRIEVVQKDLHCLRSKVENHMPGNFKRPSALNIDHSLRLIGSPEEGYIPLTEPIRQNVLEITQKIDRLSEGLAFVVQRHRRLQISKFSENSDLQSDYSGDSGLYDTKQQSTYTEGTDELGGTNYFFKYSQSNPDGHQVQIAFSHAKRYYRPSINPQGDHRNHFIQGPNYINPQPTNVIPYDRFTTCPSPRLEAARNHSRRYSTEYPSESDSLSYFPDGRHTQHGRSPSQTLSIPRSSPSFRRIPTDIASNFNNHCFTKYRDEECDSYPRNYQRAGVRRTDIIRYSQY